MELSLFQIRDENAHGDEIYDTIRSLVEHGGCDPTRPSFSGWSSLHEYSGPVEPFDYMIRRQNHFMVDFKHQSASELAGLTMSLTDQFNKPLSANLTIIAMDCGLAPDLEATYQLPWNPYSSCTLMQLEIQRLVHYYISGVSLDASLSLIGRYLKNGSDPHAISSLGATAFDYILSYTGSNNCRPKASLLLEWLRLLSNAKFDLRDYCRKEETIHGQNKIIQTTYVRPQIDSYFHIEYHNTPDYITIRVTDVSHDIWELPQIPGAWIEVHNGYQRDEFGRGLDNEGTTCLEEQVSTSDL